MLSTLSLSAALLIQPSSHFDRRSALLGGAFALTSPQATHAADAAIPDTWTLSGGDAVALNARMEVDVRDSGRDRFAEGGSRGAGAEAGGVERERRI